MKYKINIHAHTIFSDGYNSPYMMALKAKELGFASLVITDHYYGRKSTHCLSKLKYALLKKACQEAKSILPIILGIEYTYMNEEILVFGSAFINKILSADMDSDKPDMATMLEWKRIHNGACILCHPRRPKNWKNLRPLLDGFERYNSGCDMFARNRAFCSLQNLPGWCNSDAHGEKVLDWCYNIVDSNIETEGDLIKYIKRGKQPEFFVK